MTTAAEQRAQDEADELAQAMSLLSPQEREALGYEINEDGTGGASQDLINEVGNNGQQEQRELPAPTEDALKKKPTDDEDEDEGDELPDNLPAAKAAEAAPAPAPAPEAAPEPDAPREQSFIYNAPPVENYDQRMTDLQGERAKALKDFMAGELTDEEYAAIDSRTLNEREQLAAQQNRHVLAEEMRQQQAEREWNAGVNSVLKVAKAEGVDYAADPKLAKSWDGWVRQLGADPENNDKPADWFPKEAHRLVKLQYNLSNVEARQETPPAAAAKPAAAQPQNKRAPDLSSIPPSLSNVPAAAVESEGDTGEFAYLEGLQGLALERALAKMSPDQADRYLAS